MFGNTCRAVSLTGPIADNAFPGIKVDDFREDVTMEAVARALYAPRGVQARIRFCSIEDFDPTMAVDAVADYLRSDEDGSVRIVDVFSEDNLKSLRDNIDVIAPGYEYVELVSKKLREFTRTQESEQRFAVYRSADSRKSVVFARRINASVWHVIASTLPVLTPWFFEVRTTAEEQQMLLTLVDPRKNGADFTAAIERIATKFDLQTAAKRYYLEGFERKTVDVRIRNVKRNLDDVRRSVADYVRRTNELYEKISLYQAELFGLENCGSDSKNELMEYFISNPKLFVADMDGNNVRYFVAGCADNWDENNLDVIVENKDSVLWRAFENNARSSRIDRDGFEKLFNAVFVDGTIKVKLASQWKVGFGCGIEPVSSPDMPAQLEDYLPNPHLCYFGCTGSWASDLNKAANNHDFVQAVDITSIENGNINWLDTTVVPRFVKDFVVSTKKAFILPDGMEVTNSEAVAWLNANE